MSWSDDRSKGEKKLSLETRRNHLRQVNLVLEKLSKDEDLHDDLKLSEVKQAIKHWTGQNRLPPEEAVKLTDHRRVVYVLQRLQMLQSVCKEALISVPFEQFISGASQIPDALATSLFGEDIIDGPRPKSDSKPATTTPSQSAAKPIAKPEIIAVSEPVTKPQEADVLAQQPVTSSTSTTYFGAALLVTIIAIIFVAFRHNITILYHTN